MKPAAATIDRWWQDLSAHQQMDGGCPKCGTRGRCRPWAEAFSELVAHDLLLPHAAMPAASPPPAEPPHYDHRDGFTMHRPDQGARDNRAFWEAANRVTIPEQASHLNGLLDQVLRYLRGHRRAQCRLRQRPGSAAQQPYPVAEFQQFPDRPSVEAWQRSRGDAAGITTQTPLGSNHRMEDI